MYFTSFWHNIVNIFDTYINSVILEFTWFEVQPLNFHAYIQQPEDIMEFFNTLTNDDIDAHLSLNYYMDAFSVKLFRIKYPAFCAVELSAILNHEGFITCGYDGDYQRIPPLHA